MKLGKFQEQLRSAELVAPPTAELPPWARAAATGSPGPWMAIDPSEPITKRDILYSKVHDRLVWAHEQSLLADELHKHRVTTYLEGKRYQSWVRREHLYRVPLEQCFLCEGEPRTKLAPRCANCGGFLVQIAGNMDDARWAVDCGGMLAWGSKGTDPMSIAELEGTNEDNLKALAMKPVFSPEHNAVVLVLGHHRVPFGIEAEVDGSAALKIQVRVATNKIVFNADVAPDKLFHLDLHDCGWCDGTGQDPHAASMADCRFCDGVKRWPIPGDIVVMRHVLSKQPRFADFLLDDGTAMEKRKRRAR